jgi:hypothetical protein
MAFKIIRDFVEKPVLMILCDRSCPMNATMIVEPGFEDQPAVQVEFLKQATSQGWVLNMEHVCPAHAKAEREARPRVVPAMISVVRN